MQNETQGNTRYEIEFVFSEKNHVLTEKWTCEDISELKKNLCYALNLNFRNGEAEEPNVENLSKVLGKYVSDKDIDEEMERETKSYGHYIQILDYMRFSEDGRTEVRLDSQTTIYTRTLRG